MDKLQEHMKFDEKTGPVMNEMRLRALEEERANRRFMMLMGIIAALWIIVIFVFVAKAAGAWNAAVIFAVLQIFAVIIIFVLGRRKENWKS